MPSAEESAKETGPGPLATLHAAVRVDESGSQSSLAVPCSAATAGSVTF